MYQEILLEFNLSSATSTELEFRSRLPTEFITHDLLTLRTPLKNLCKHLEFHTIPTKSPLLQNVHIDVKSSREVITRERKIEVRIPVNELIEVLDKDIDVVRCELKELLKMLNISEEYVTLIEDLIRKFIMNEAKKLEISDDVVNVLVEPLLKVYIKHLKREVEIYIKHLKHEFTKHT